MSNHNREVEMKMTQWEILKNKNLSWKLGEKLITITCSKSTIAHIEPTYFHLLLVKNVYAVHYGIVYQKQWRIILLVM